MAIGEYLGQLIFEERASGNTKEGASKMEVTKLPSGSGRLFNRKRKDDPGKRYRRGDPSEKRIVASGRKSEKGGKRSNCQRSRPVVG